MKKSLLLLFLIVLFAGTIVGVSLFVIRSNYSANVRNVPQELAKTETVKIFFIAMEDNGALGKKIGCNDSAVAALRNVESSKATMQGALEELLSIKDQYYGESGLYNSLSLANLQVEQVTIENGKATIRLSGEYSFTGVCEDARFMSQIEETAMQFDEVKDVEIILNSRSLDNMYKGE